MHHEKEVINIGFNLYEAEVTRRLEERYGPDYLGIFVGKLTGILYHTIRTDEYPFKVSFEAYSYDTCGKHLLLLDGFCRLENVKGTEDDPRAFLSLPEVSLYDPIFCSSFFVHRRKDGIAGNLFRFLAAYLQHRNCLHIVSFSEDGFRALRPKCQEEGYLPIEITKPEEVSPRFIGLTGWMYKRYTGRPEALNPRKCYNGQKEIV